MNENTQQAIKAIKPAKAIFYINEMAKNYITNVLGNDPELSSEVDEVRFSVSYLLSTLETRATESS